MKRRYRKKGTEAKGCIIWYIILIMKGRLATLFSSVLQYLGTSAFHS